MHVVQGDHRSLAVNNRMGGNRTFTASPKMCPTIEIKQNFIGLAFLVVCGDHLGSTRNWNMLNINHKDDRLPSSP
ncbi:hypothetical protein DFP92_1314 [Yoonia sediminilitoris]|uniref:Uncharacterized protein n=1 Tax=Yoonia sediminilitoris TaxID=1286148 RepID=A0A2T6K457_9RHOB|nr:hypothetical protein C8N45_1314 [Yoonia sediminilitoris]RCW89472.1 hypothetical protein DFP92_1314 [Yoonia sediminilitoris]